MIWDVQKQVKSVQWRVDKLTRSDIVTTAFASEKIGLQVDKLSSTTESIKANTDVTLNSVHDLEQVIAQMNLKNEGGVEGLNSLVKVLQETFRRAECKSWQAPLVPVWYCSFIFRGLHESERRFRILTDYRESEQVASGDPEEKNRRKVKA